MGRLKAQRVAKVGLHTDYSWPGQIHSVWKRGPFTLRRERVYTRGDNVVLRQLAWQWTIAFGKFKFGARAEKAV